MLRHPKTVLDGTISLIEKPKQKIYRFALDIEQRLYSNPEVNPVAIYGTIDYDLNLERVINDNLNVTYKELFYGTKHEILAKVNEIINNNLKGNN